MLSTKWPKIWTKSKGEDLRITISSLIANGYTAITSLENQILQEWFRLLSTLFLSLFTPSLFFQSHWSYYLFLGIHYQADNGPLDRNVIQTPHTGFNCKMQVMKAFHPNRSPLSEKKPRWFIFVIWLCHFFLYLLMVVL